MVEDEMTGYLKGRFLRQINESQRVLNFFVKSNGYYNEKKMRYEPLEYPFETWLNELIDKVSVIPRDSLVTVRFSLFPKRKEIDGKSVNYVVLKALSVTNWAGSKGGETANEEGEQVEWKLNFGSSELSPEGSEWG
ncbi:hypothetical protein AV654_19550 [Paenibacillus elgii]|uniref:Uncharacterized protein n=1 Tax=Paenibacillus elgii TaxID=189691 RepID=A0A163XND0_9BACL|nr:hypothetical protein [Paenibacillus elgii]KZE78173.1 hypothetical protein AV654_19550 [Paenibacillus elgii]